MSVEKVLNIKVVYKDEVKPTEKFIGSPDEAKEIAKRYIDEFINSSNSNVSGLFIRVVD